MDDHQGGGGDVGGWECMEDMGDGEVGMYGRGGVGYMKGWGGIYEGVGVGSIERVGGMKGVGRWRCVEGVGRCRCVEEAFGEITA